MLKACPFRPATVHPLTLGPMNLQSLAQKQTRNVGDVGLSREEVNIIRSKINTEYFHWINAAWVGSVEEQCDYEGTGTRSHELITLQGLWQPARVGTA